MLIDIATVNEAVRALGEVGRRFGEDGFDGLLAAAAHQNRTARGLHDLVIVGSVVGGIGLDHVGPEFAGLAHEGDDELFVAVDLVAALGLVGLEDERLDHQRHAVVVARGAEAGGVEGSLAMEVGFARHEEKVADDAGGVGHRWEEWERHELREGHEHGAEGVTTTATHRPNGRNGRSGLRDSRRIEHGDDHRISSGKAHSRD